MPTHEHAWGPVTASSSPSLGAETPALTIPKANPRPEPSCFQYDPDLLGDFFVEWQQAASLHRPGGQSS